MTTVRHLLPLLLYSIFALLSAGCSDRSRATTDREFAEELARAFQSQDSELFHNLSHPQEPETITLKTRELLESLMELRPEKVSSSLIRLAEVDIDLPGALDGKPLKFTARVHGVVRLDAVLPSDSLLPEGGEKGELTLYLPFHKAEGRYYLAPVDYAPIH